MEVKTQAIVLHTLKYGDSQLIVDMFTEKLGKVSFAVRIATSSRSRMKRQYFQNMNLLFVEFDYRQKANLQKLRNVSIAVPYKDIPFSPYKMSMSMFLAEFLSRCLRHEQANAALFLFLKNSLSWLDEAGKGYANFHIVFMIHLTLFLGFMPNVEIKEGNVFFDLQEGCFVPRILVRHPYLQGHDTELMRTLLRLNYSTMHLFTMTRDDRNRCVEVILEYYKLHLPDFPELKSLDILKELFV